MQMPQEKTFKKIGQSVEAAFKRLDEGLNLLEQIEDVEDEMERERYTALAAMNLHHSWHSMVRVFRKIAKDVDGGVPKGQQANKMLIDQMFQRTNDRPSVLSTQHRATIQKLVEFYRKFRNSPDEIYSRREVGELMDSLHEEIVPSVLESARIMALASPGGQKMISYLQASKVGAGDSEIDHKRTG